MSKKCSCVSILKSWEFLPFKTFIYLFGIVLAAFSETEVLLASADLNTWKRKWPNNITETMTEYISWLRKPEYKLEIEKMQKQFNFKQVKEQF